jgi:hypothetical protein
MVIPGVPNGVTQEQAHHLFSFAFSVGNADQYLRGFTRGEVAVVVAEDSPEMRRLLKNGLALMRQQPWELGNPGDPVHRIERIVDTVHFVKQDEAPLLSLVDACASQRRLSRRGSHLRPRPSRQNIGSSGARRLMANQRRSC